MKKALLTLLSASAFAAHEPCSFLNPSRPCVSNPCLLDQSDAYVQLSLLYWVAQERGLDYALKNDLTQNNERLELYQPSFRWEPAFRLVVGGHLPHDNWRLDFTYSFFLKSTQDAAKHHFIGNFGEGLLAVWTAPGAFVNGNLYARWQLAEAQWKLHANFFDLMLRNDLSLGTALTFAPAVGLKMALLQQRYEVAYSFGSSFTDGATEQYVSSTIHLKNRSFNVGPAAGLQTRWCLNPHWSLGGSLSGSILASRFDLGRNEQDVSQTTSTQTGSYRFNRYVWTWRPQTSLSFGIEWGDCSCSPRKVVHYGLRASYEMQYWWKQNMMLRHIDAPIVQSHTLASVQGDLQFQGVTVDLFFDF